MKINNFSLAIPEGRETEKGEIELLHGSTYRLSLKNEGTFPADVTITIDGKVQGIWRVSTGGYLLLERPDNDDGKFTFYFMNSEEAKTIDLQNIEKDLRGLVQASFQPGASSLFSQGNSTIPYTDSLPWIEPYIDYTTNAARSPNQLVLRSTAVSCYAGLSNPVPPAAERDRITGEGYAQGATGLSGYSEQTFTSVQPLNPIGEPTVISLRLVGVKKVTTARPL